MLVAVWHVEHKMLFHAKYARFFSAIFFFAIVARCQKLWYNDGK